MGIYSTMAITREDALCEIIEHLKTATDEDLAGALFVLCGEKTLKNFQIVAGYNEANGFPYVYEPESLDTEDE